MKTKKEYNEYSTNNRFLILVSLNSNQVTINDCFHFLFSSNLFFPQSWELYNRVAFDSSRMAMKSYRGLRTNASIRCVPRFINILHRFYMRAPWLIIGCVTLVPILNYSVVPDSGELFLSCILEDLRSSMQKL